MLATDRQSLILDILSKEKSVRNSELVKILNVSLETIRRDLDYLEKDGLLEKVHGGAKQKVKVVETPYSQRVLKNISEKIELAKLAVNFIENGDIIALNSSSTNIEIAKLIREKNISVTILTNSLLIANEVSTCANINMILAGGVYSQKEFAFLGQVTADFLNNFTANKCFLSVGGVSLDKGVTDFYMDEVLVEKKLIDISKEIIVVADSSKFENNSLFCIAPLKDINFIITDSKVEDNIKELYMENGVKVINK